jgi:hypothetical protein
MDLRFENEMIWGAERISRYSDDAGVAPADSSFIIYIRELHLIANVIASNASRALSSIRSIQR